MRLGMRNGWLNNNDGSLLGINLGADYCAEHEWGIKRLKSLLQLDDNAEPGEARYRTNCNTIDQHIYTGLIELPISTRNNSKKQSAYLIIIGPRTAASIESDPLRLIRDCPSTFESLAYRGGLITAWDEASFGILTTDIVAAQHLEKAIRSNDLYVGLMGGGVFENAGLKLLIASNTPQEIKDTWKRNHQEAARLQAASDATGIIAALKKVNDEYYAANKNGWLPPCGYYACLPRWINDSLKTKSKHPVMYWLNPCNQQNNQCGWYTVEELQQWMEGKGPVKNVDKKHR